MLPVPTRLSPGCPGALTPPWTSAKRERPRVLTPAPPRGIAASSGPVACPRGHRGPCAAGREAEALVLVSGTSGLGEHRSPPPFRPGESLSRV